jgi:trigger factor
MLQVKETVNQGLKREFAIVVPSDIINQSWQKKLAEIAKTAKFDGFRPGKVPMPVIEQRYGPSARAEVLDDSISDAVEKTLTERKLRPAAQPKIDLVSFAPGKDVEFKVALEVLPEIPAVDFSKIAVEKPVAEVAESEIDETITRASRNFIEPMAVTDGRSAQIGDVLVIDFDGSVGGEKRPGMKGSDHKLELGSKSFIPGFEEQLVGVKAGANTVVKVTFPSDYHAADLSGQEAVFVVDVKEIRAHEAFVINDELATKLGFEDLAKLRERIKNETNKNYANIARGVMKRTLMDKIAALVNFEIPAVMLEAEFGNIWEQVEQSKKSGQLPPDELKKSDDELKSEYRAIAERRIRLGLLLADVAEKRKVEVSSADLRNALMAEARRFPGQEKSVVDYYTKTEGALERLRAPILEEKVIDAILAEAKVTEKKMNSDELMAMPEED